MHTVTFSMDLGKRLWQWYASAKNGGNFFGPVPCGMGGWQIPSLSNRQSSSNQPLRAA